MSKTVLKAYGLSTLAKEIRTRHDDMICDIYCDDDCAICQPSGSAHHFEDEAARRWAAKKLTVPLEPSDDGEDFTPEEWVDVHCEIWKMRMAITPRNAQPDVRFKRYADQLKHSTKFVRDIWGLKSNEAEDATIGNDDEIDFDTEIDIETDMEDLFNFDDDDDDVSHIDTSATSEDPGPPIPAEYDPNKIH